MEYPHFIHKKIIFHFVIAFYFVNGGKLADLQGYPRFFETNLCVFFLYPSGGG